MARRLSDAPCPTLIHTSFFRVLSIPILPHRHHHVGNPVRASSSSFSTDSTETSWRAETLSLCFLQRHACSATAYHNSQLNPEALNTEQGRVLIWLVFDFKAQTGPAAPSVWADPRAELQEVPCKQKLLKKLPGLEMRDFVLDIKEWLSPLNCRMKPIKEQGAMQSLTLQGKQDHDYPVCPNDCSSTT